MSKCIQYHTEDLTCFSKRRPYLFKVLNSICNWYFRRNSRNGKKSEKVYSSRNWRAYKRKLEICRDVPGYVGREEFKSIFEQINNYKNPPHDPFIFTENESSDGEDKNENTDSEDNMDLEIKDLEIKAFINDKNFEKKFKKHFLVVTRNLEKKIKVADIIFVYSTFRKGELNSIFENIDNKMFHSKETISIATV